jgi:uncharacterized membrane protein YbhN (UPF0104 family)
MQLLQILVSVALLVLLTRRVRLADVATAASKLTVLPLVLGTLLALVGYLGRAYRWRLLLARVGVPMNMATAYRLTLAGTAYGLVTPGRVGEFARILHVDAPRARMLASAVWDRMADVLLLEIMSLPAFLMFPAWRGWPLVLFLGLIAATGVLAWLLNHPPAFRALATRFPAIRNQVEGFAEASSAAVRNIIFGGALLGGVFFYIFNYTCAYLLIQSLSPGSSPLLLSALPVIPLLGNLPIAFGGLGLREHVSATVFIELGLGAANGTVFSLSWFVTMTVIPGLIGLALNLTPFGRLSPPTPEGAR